MTSALTIINDDADDEHLENGHEYALKAYAGAYDYACCRAPADNHADAGGVHRGYARDCAPSLRGHVRAHAAPSGAARPPAPSTIRQ